MRLLTPVRIALHALGRHRLRTTLTVLGIGVGIAAVVCTVALGQGSAARVQQQMVNLGDNFIWIENGNRNVGGVRTGAGGAQKLDVEEAWPSPTIARGQPLLTERRRPRAGIRGNQNWYTRYRGVSPDYCRSSPGPSPRAPSSRTRTCRPAPAWPSSADGGHDAVRGRGCRGSDVSHERSGLHGGVRAPGAGHRHGRPGPGRHGVAALFDGDALPKQPGDTGRRHHVLGDIGRADSCGAAGHRRAAARAPPDSRWRAGRLQSACARAMRCDLQEDSARTLGLMLSAIASVSLTGRRRGRDEHHAGLGHGAHARNRRFAWLSGPGRGTSSGSSWTRQCTSGCWAARRRRARDAGSLYLRNCFGRPMVQSAVVLGATRVLGGRRAGVRLLSGPPRVPIGPHRGAAGRVAPPSEGHGPREPTTALPPRVTMTH